MNVFEIIAGSLLLICCLALVILVMLQEPKQGGLGSTFGDSSTDSYFGKNSGRTLEAMLGRFRSDDSGQYLLCLYQLRNRESPALPRRAFFVYGFVKERKET